MQWYATPFSSLNALRSSTAFSKGASWALRSAMNALAGELQPNLRKEVLRNAEITIMHVYGNRVERH